MGSLRKITGVEDQKHAARQAAGLQSDAADKATDLTREMFNENKARLDPWVTAGSGSLNSLAREMTPGGSLYDTDFTAEDFNENKDPGYDWRVKQGQNALAAQSSAMGNLGSGNLGTALVDYGQNAASQEYQNAYNRYMNSQNTLYDRLYNLSSMGGNAAAGVANMGSNSASQMGEYGLQGANALATGALTAGNLNGQFKQDLFNQIAGQFGFTMGGGGSSGGSGMNSLMGGLSSAGGSMGSGLESMFGLGAIGII